jgi:hypothetical protein
MCVHRNVHALHRAVNHRAVLQLDRHCLVDELLQESALTASSPPRSRHHSCHHHRNTKQVELNVLGFLFLPLSLSPLSLCFDSPNKLHPEEQIRTVTKVSERETSQITRPLNFEMLLKPSLSDRVDFSCLTAFERAWLFGPRGSICAHVARLVLADSWKVLDESDAHDREIEATLLQFHIDQLFVPLQHRFTVALTAPHKTSRALPPIRSPFDDATLRTVSGTLNRIWFERLRSVELAVLRGGAVARSRCSSLFVDSLVSLCFWLCVLAVLWFAPRSVATFVVQRNDRIVQGLQLTAGLTFVLFHVRVERAVLNGIAIAVISLFVGDTLFDRPLLMMAAAAARFLVLVLGVSVMLTVSERSVSKLLHLWRFRRGMGAVAVAFEAKRAARLAAAAAAAAKAAAASATASAAAAAAERTAKAVSPPVKRDGAVAAALGASRPRTTAKKGAGAREKKAVAADATAPPAPAPAREHLTPIAVATTPRDILAPPELDTDFLSLFDDVESDSCDFASLYEDERHTLLLFGSTE